ncbi:MAG: gamma-glutamyl-gamma-aminobutyrate hydrolase family protein [Bacillota bacterium]
MAVPGPLIGVSCHYDVSRQTWQLGEAYAAAVYRAGGLPVALLPGDAGAAEELIKRLDGIILAGGVDVDPVHWGEEPQAGCGEIVPAADTFELALARCSLQWGKPLLGICRGMQILNVAAGGSLYQDINTQLTGVLKHSQQAPRSYATHRIFLAEGTLLGRLLGCRELRVNSFHHQAVRRLAEGFQVTARAADGVIEALEHPALPFVIGVQFHPEAMWQESPLFLELFTGLVRASRGESVF